MKVAFAGTPEFAATALQAIHAAGHHIPLVLTQPDRPAGRGMQLQPSPVKRFALEHGLKVSQPQGLKLDGRYAEDARAAQAALLEAAPDVMVVAAYGLILPAWALELPRLGCVNIHASLLPRWRGAAPIHRAIEAGDERTGVCLMQMDAGLDTGDVLREESVPIAPDDTTATLHDRLAALGARMTVDLLPALERAPRRAQPADGITYASKIEKAEAAIDWRQPAAAIERRIRAFDPFPGATCGIAGETVKLWRAELQPGSGVPGTLSGEFVVQCGEGALKVTQLQRPGGKRISAAEFMRARPLPRAVD